MLRVLTGADVAAQAPWCRLIRSVFTRAGFERWIEWGCWGADYQACAWFEGGRPVANVSRTRMRLLLDGGERDGWQFGAVCTAPDQRGRGLARRLMDAALADCGDDPVLLFANPTVLDFYPRFGFVAREEWIFEAAHRAAPGAVLAPILDPGDPEVRALVRRLAATGRPCTQRFGARGHGDLVLWYLANGFAPAPRQPAPGVLVSCTREDDCLAIHEVLADADVDLAALIPQLIDAPVRRLRFGFTPERLWPAARALEPDPGSFLHLRGLAPAAPHRFPVLAHT